MLWSGGRWERTAALLNLANWFCNAFAEPPRAELRHAFPWGNLAVDAAFLVLFVALALTVRRTWAALLASLLLLGVINYLGYLSDSRLFQRAFATAAYVWAYGALACLVFAGWSARRARGGRSGIL